MWKLLKMTKHISLTLNSKKFNFYQEWQELQQSIQRKERALLETKSKITHPVYSLYFPEVSGICFVFSLSHLYFLQIFFICLLSLQYQLRRSEYGLFLIGHILKGLFTKYVQLFTSGIVNFSFYSSLQFCFYQIIKDYA